ncbi:alpha/beta hydrolase [Actinomycetes bacterium KLBMP 9797]
MSNTAKTRRGRPAAATTRIRVSDGDELDVWVSGDGDPVVFVHGALTRDLLEPLAAELAQRDGYQTIRFGRRGHGGRGLPAERADIPGQASDVATILDALGIDRAHVAGHSFGALIALELATRAPERLRSAILLEAPLVQTEAMQRELPDLQEAMSLLATTYTSGDTDGAVARFWEFTSGLEGAAELIEPALPDGARALAAADLSTWLQVDLPAMGSWMVDPAAVKELTTPIVWIGASDSSPVFGESRALLQEWLPSTRTAEIAGAGHYFPVLMPAETAAALDEVLRTLRPAQTGGVRIVP